MFFAFLRSMFESKFEGLPLGSRSNLAVCFWFQKSGERNVPSGT